MMHFGNMTGWGMGFWWISGLIMMALFIGVLYLLFTRISSGNRFQHETARNIPAKRFASGQITKEEYDSMLKNM